MARATECGQGGEEVLPHAAFSQSHEAAVDRRWRAILRAADRTIDTRCSKRARCRLSPFCRPHVGGQMRFDPDPLFVC
jgi:hypothetical protein